MSYNYDGTGFYLQDTSIIPAGSTTEPPPELQPQQAARFINGAWTIIPDLVFTKYYLNDAEHMITERGVELPAAATLEKPQSMLDGELQAAKSSAISLIEQKANEYHAQLVGTSDKSREARFALNLELAQKLLAGTATAVEQQALQMQLDANQQAGHPVLSGKTLELFAQWIVQYKGFSTLGSGLIEATLIKGRAAINAAQSMEEIEQIKSQLAQQAQTAFTQLQTKLSG